MVGSVIVHGIYNVPNFIIHSPSYYKSWGAVTLNRALGIRVSPSSMAKII